MKGAYEGVAARRRPRWLAEAGHYGGGKGIGNSLAGQLTQRSQQVAVPTSVVTIARMGALVVGRVLKAHRYDIEPSWQAVVTGHAGLGKQRREQRFDELSIGLIPDGNGGGVGVLV